MRPLNFTGRRRCTTCVPRWYELALGLRLNGVLEADSHPNVTSSNNLLWQKRADMKINMAHITIGSVITLLLAGCATTNTAMTTPHAVNATVTTGYNQALHKRVAVSSFAIEDSIVCFVDFTWSDVTHGAGVHVVEWRWYKQGALVSQSQKKLTFNSSPYSTWTTRAASSLGPGHYSVDTVLDGQVAHSSEFEIKEPGAPAAK